MNLACSHSAAVGCNQSSLCIRCRSMSVLKNLYILAANFDHPPCDRKERLIYFFSRFDAYPQRTQVTY